jgi:hypothetical protein
MGTGSVQLCSDLINYPITLTDVLYIPHCPVNLLSVNAIALSHDCKVTFDRTSCIATRGTSLIWTFPASSDGVYKFACQSCTVSELCNTSDSFPAFALEVDASGGVVIPTTLEWLWHRRLGHPGLSTMRTLVSDKLVKNLPLTPHHVKKLAWIPCDACNKAKAKRLPFPKVSTTEVHAPLHRLHLDIMGPFSVKGLRG